MTVSSSLLLLGFTFTKTNISLSEFNSIYDDQWRISKLNYTVAETSKSTRVDFYQQALPDVTLVTPASSSVAQITIKIIYSEVNKFDPEIQPWEFSSGIRTTLNISRNKVWQSYSCKKWIVLWYCILFMVSGWTNISWYEPQTFKILFATIKQDLFGSHIVK